MKHLWRILVLVCLTTCTLEALAQQSPITHVARFTGNVNFVATGGSLRTESDTGDSCEVRSTSSQSLSGIPANASIVAAYLYWGGSGSNVDSNVTLNGSNVSAQRTFQATFENGNTDFPYFGGFANVTNRISGNANITFGGLSVTTGNPHCGSSAVVAGWGLVVVYGSPSERLRAVNVFDGLQFFRGNSLTLTPNGFRIPSNNIDGRMAIIAWEGDPGNSDPLNGSSESLSFNGSALNDGINVPNSNPLVQPFDGTVNSQNVNNSYGVDVDTFTVSNLLSPGQTSATTLFSAGGDLVLLTAQVVSVTSEPIVDLSITKSHVGDFSVGTNGTYTISVANAAGSQSTDYPITVTDTLPAGLSFVSASGTGWSCSASGQTVTCTHAGPLAPAAALPNLSLVVSVGAAAFPSVTNTVSVATASYDPNTTNNTASDPTTVTGPNLSTSTKTVQDLNGGDANPGDTLRYTITLRETAGVAVTGASVTDEVPANVSGFTSSGISIPAGASNASTYGTTGANGTGRLNITGINVPANGTATLTFDVQVAAGISPGATIDNSATVVNPAGPGATPSAPQLIVSQSQIPGSGTKPLYLWNQPSRNLSRLLPTGNHPSVTLDGGGESATWTLTPALQTPLTLQPGNFAARLLLARAGSGFLLGNNRQVTVSLMNSALGTLASVTNVITPPNGSPQLFDFTLTLPNSVTAPVGSTFSLVVTNSSFVFLSDPRINVFALNAGDVSRVDLQSATVIDVNSVQAFNAPYPGGVATVGFSPGSTVYARAVVSDPFGSFDITGANITILDPASNVIANNVAMTSVNDSGAAIRTYQYAFVVPANASPGVWTMRVIAREGTENTVTDLGIGTFQLATPAIEVQKLSEVLSDPMNGSVNPKRIPGSLVRYSITVTNAGAGTVDPSTLIVTDAIANGLALYASNTNGSPVEFVDGASGLSFNYLTDLRFSNQPGGGPPYSYTPVPDSSGFDPSITGVRVAPTGTMLGSSGASSPSFTIRFVVKVQ